jgi:hypothetical protein
MTKTTTSIVAVDDAFGDRLARCPADNQQRHVCCIETPA